MFSRGDLVLVPFPFSDLSSTKRRPVLALTAPNPQGDFLALAVTSQPTALNAVVIDAQDLIKGSLPKPSWIRGDRIVTLHDSLVVKHFGTLSDQAFANALVKACEYLGCRK